MQPNFTLTTFTPAEAEKISTISTAMQRDGRRRGFLPAFQGHARFDPFDVARMWAIKMLADRGIGRFCHASRRLRWSARRELFRSCDLHDADRDASVMEEVTAPVGCRNVLVVTGSAAEEVAEFIVLSAEPVGRAMLLEAAHTSDPPLRLRQRAADQWRG